MTAARELVTVRGIKVVQFSEQNRVLWTSGAMIDADGANGQTIVDGVRQFAYRHDNTGLDDLRNAGYPRGQYWNVLVCDSKRTPVAVNGGWISSTAYEWVEYARTDPHRYVDAVTVPYVVVNPKVRLRAKGVVLGCKARITYLGLTIDAVVADVSGPNDIGELSIAAADLLGIDSDPRTGGISEHVVIFELFPGTPAIVGGRQYALIRA
jgi:hypothetical protein